MNQDPTAPAKDAPKGEQDAPEKNAPYNTGPSTAPQASSDHPQTKADDAPGPPVRGDVIKTRRPRMIVCTLGAALAGLLAAWCFAVVLPNYLLYETPLIKADAAVLFLGPGEEARRQQVDELVAKGWAKFIIIPWKGEVIETQVSKALVTPEKTARMARAMMVEFKKSFVERTHVEVLQTLELMKHIAVKRAILVSSPYHMRRIKIMVDHVFPAGEYAIAYLPTAYDPPHWPWFAHWQDVKWVFSEWVKIGWFILYKPFV
jgi:hypothetical protein